MGALLDLTQRRTSWLPSSTARGRRSCAPGRVGKTRVIVERAVRLIDDGAARPEELLVLTFSRKAASELRERIAARLRRSYASFPVTTFHAFCHALLARHAADPPRLARPAERRALARLALEAEDGLGYPPSAALVEEALAFASLCDDYLHVPAWTCVAERLS